MLMATPLNGIQPFRTVRGNNVRVNILGTLNGIAACDVKNITNLDRRSPGETADLDIESLFIDSTDNVRFEDVFGRIRIALGTGGEVLIPDLYADTNGDGILDDSDTLYSLVDLHQYLQAIPTFSLGDTFMIVNGEVNSLPGMLFSSTPFTFDPAVGPLSTPYDG